MLIKKGGITRNIDASRLAEYKAKGYKVAAEVDPLQEIVENPREADFEAAAEKLNIDKALGQMKTEELEAIAKELSIDLSAITTNADRATAIAAWVEAYAEE